MNIRKLIRAAVGLLLAGMVPARALAVPGDIDLGFGSGGFWAPAPECCGAARPGAIALQADGKVVIVGSASNGEVEQTIAMRFNADGTRDAAFGLAGFVRRPVGTGTNKPSAVVVQTDGRIVVAGNYTDSGGLLQPFVMRLSPAGAVDATFGAGGLRLLPAPVAGSSSASILSMLLLADGKIVVAGTSNFGGGLSDMFAARLDASGGLDTAFGASGVARSNVAGEVSGNDVALTPSGALLVVGNVVIGGTSYPAAMRLLGGGALDATFDGDGLAIPLFGFPGSARSAVVEPDGRAIVAGVLNSGPATYRLTVSGSLDLTYNGTGVQAHPGVEASRVRLTAGGNHLVVSRQANNEMQGGGYLRRVRPDGSFDAAWNGGNASLFGPVPAPDLATNALGEVFVASDTATSPFGSDGIRTFKFTSGGAPVGGFGALSFVGLVSPSGEFESIARHGAKLVVARRAECSDNTAECSTVTRLDANGSPDPDFGAGGSRFLQSVRVTGHVAVRADGKVLFMRHFDCDPSPSNTVPCRRVDRLNADGSDDATFTAPTLTGTGDAPAMVLLTLGDGRFVFADSASLRRYLESGAVDPSFNLGSALNGNIERWRAVAEGSASSLVLAGATGSNPNETARVSRRMGSGALDLSFGTNGYAAISLPGYFTRADAVAVQPDGRIITGGPANASGSPYVCFAARLDASGVLDASFGNGGIRQIPGIGRCELGGIAVQPDGRIVIAGVVVGGTPPWRAFAARLEANGALDATFGSGGVVFPDLGAGNETARSLALQPDGGIVIGGSVRFGIVGSSYPSRFAVYRLLGATSPISIGPDAFPVGGVGVPYQLTLLATGGSAPYSFSLASGTPPPGTALNGAEFAGTPTAPGRFDLVVRATDNDGLQSSRAYSWTVHDAASLVDSYYQSILGRPADQGGSAFWRGEAARVQALGASVSEAFYVLSTVFFGSAEYSAQGNTDVDYVTDLYRTFFAREPDSGGLAYWTGQLGAGKPRGALLNDFLFSDEFRLFMAGVFGGATGSRAEASMVMDFYRGFLARLPDDGGFDYWVGRFRAAQCNNSVTAEADTMSVLFASSAEYANRGAARAPAERTRGYVVDLYNAFLRRGSDLSGFQYWTDQIDGGSRTREQVRLQFVASPEFQARVQAVIQQGCLN